MLRRFAMFPVFALIWSGCAVSSRTIVSTTDDGESLAAFLSPDRVGQHVRITTEATRYQGRIVTIDTDQRTVLLDTRGEAWRSESAVPIPFEQIETLSEMSFPWANVGVLSGVGLATVGLYALVRGVSPKGGVDPRD